MSYDAGNPSRPARMITAGTFLVLVGHLVRPQSGREARQARPEAAEDA